MIFHRRRLGLRRAAGGSHSRHARAERPATPTDRPATSTDRPATPPDRAVVPPALPSDQPMTRDGQEIMPGLLATLYNGPEFNAISETRLVRRVRAATMDSSARGEIPLSLKWNGLLNIPAGGMTVQFQLGCMGQWNVTVDGMNVAQTTTIQNAKLTAGIHTVAISASHLQGMGASKSSRCSGSPRAKNFRWFHRRC